MAANEFETVNRYKRARELADHLKSFGINSLNSVPVAKQLETAGRALGWDSPPSVATWTLASYLLEEGR